MRSCVLVFHLMHSYLSLKRLARWMSAWKRDYNTHAGTTPSSLFYSGGASQHSISFNTDSGRALEQQSHRPQSTLTTMLIQPPTHPSTESPGRPGSTHPEADEVSAEQSTSGKPKRTKKHMHRFSHGIWAGNGALPPFPPPSAAGALQTGIYSGGGWTFGHGSLAAACFSLAAISSNDASMMSWQVVEITAVRPCWPCRNRPRHFLSDRSASKSFHKGTKRLGSFNAGGSWRMSFRRRRLSLSRCHFPPALGRRKVG